MMLNFCSRKPSDRVYVTTQVLTGTNHFFFLISLQKFWVQIILNFRKVNFIKKFSKQWSSGFVVP